MYFIQLNVLASIEDKPCFRKAISIKNVLCFRFPGFAKSFSGAGKF